METFTVTQEHLDIIKCQAAAFKQYMVRRPNSFWGFAHALGWEYGGSLIKVGMVLTEDEVDDYLNLEHTKKLYEIVSIEAAKVKYFKNPDREDDLEIILGMATEGVNKVYKIVTGNDDWERATGTYELYPYKNDE